MWGSALVNSDSLTVVCENHRFRVSMVSGVHLHCLLLVSCLKDKITPGHPIHGNIAYPAFAETLSDSELATLACEFKTVTALPCGHAWHHRSTGVQALGGLVVRMGDKPIPAGDFAVVAELHSVFKHIRMPMLH
jgi:hypothetical protein